MRKFEIVLGVTVIAGIVLKLLKIPGSGILIVLSLTILSMIYYLFSFAIFNSIRLKRMFRKESYSDTNAKRIVFAIFVGFVLSCLLMGVLFKIQIYPGGNNLMVTGLIFNVIVVMVSMFSFLKVKSIYSKLILFRSLVIGLVSFLVYVLIP